MKQPWIVYWWNVRDKIGFNPFLLFLIVKVYDVIRWRARISYWIEYKLGLLYENQILFKENGNGYEAKLESHLLRSKYGNPAEALMAANILYETLQEKWGDRDNG